MPHHYLDSAPDSHYDRRAAFGMVVLSVMMTVLVALGIRRWGGHQSSQPAGQVALAWGCYLGALACGITSFLVAVGPLRLAATQKRSWLCLGACVALSPSCMWLGVQPTTLLHA